MRQETMSLMDSLALLLTGVVVVFLVLVLLIFVIKIFGAIIYKSSGRPSGGKSSKGKESSSENSAAAQTSVKQSARLAAPKIESGISPEIVAVIAAAVVSMDTTKQYHITGVKKVERRGRSAWNLAGLFDSTRPF